MKRWLAIVPAVVFVAVIVGFVVGLRRDPSILPSQLIDQPLPPFDLPAVREGDVGLKSSEIAGEPMLLNVWGSWCVSCRIEHPVLMRLKSEGVIIHGVDWKDPPEKGAAWLAQFGDPYTRVGNDNPGRTAIDLGVTGAPETFVVDRKGRVRYRQVGPITREVWDEKIGPLMQKLRNES
jgi:cytochrome c biogenesis protein CcmG, thiol:disulfide interchange protein DsbE